MGKARKVYRCERCGKRRSRYSPKGLCTKCLDAEHAVRIAENQAIVAKGACPTCGRQLKRNLALTGWWQCEQYGSGHFKADQDAPSCSFQLFTA